MVSHTTPSFSADSQGGSGIVPLTVRPSGGTGSSQVTILDYHQKYFFDRESEIKCVINKIDNMLNNKNVERRTLLFTGERGTGKTWLLLHLHKSGIIKKNQTKSLYIAFEDNIKIIDDNSREFDFQFDPIIFLKKIAEIWGAETVEDTTLQEQSYWLEKFIEENTQQHVFVILLDNVATAPAEWLERLEEYWLKHLARNKRVLIVMSTRGEMYRWVAPELRLFVDIHELGPFAKKDIEEYLGKMAAYLQEKGDTQGLPYQDNIEAIYEAGGGFAFSTYWLARQGLGEAAVNGLIDFLLGFIADEQERKTIRTYLEALCVLNPWAPPGESKRAFREEEMEQVLAAHPQLAARAWSASAVREVRDALRRHHLLRWDHALGGYVLDAAVRYPVAYWLRTYHKDTWCSLHKAAAQMYRAWAGQFARYREYYDNLAKLHTEPYPEAAAAEEPPADQTVPSPLS